MKGMTFVALALAVFAGTSNIGAGAAHHERTEALPVAYVWHTELKTTRGIALETSTENFIKSGALQARGVGMGLYTVTASGLHPATHVREFYYPNAASLPSPDVMTSTKGHMALREANEEIAGEIVTSTMYKTVMEVIPAESAGEYKVFVSYHMNVSDPANYAPLFEELMKNSDNEAYGLRQVIAGDTTGETHMAWVGYRSLGDFVLGFDAFLANPKTAAAREKFAAMREVIRTAIVTTVVESSSAMFQ